MLSLLHGVFGLGLWFREHALDRGPARIRAMNPRCRYSLAFPASSAK